MANRLQPLNLSDFTGGLNLRSDPFQIAENESPDMLNVEVDPSGGVRSRRGWTRWNTTAITGGTWDPRAMHVWEQSSGVHRVLLANDGDVYAATAGTFAVLSNGVGNLVADAAPHGAAFAEWGDTIYIACGSDNQAASWSGTGSATLLAASGPTWQNDKTAPIGGYFPQADLAVTHVNYMFVAGTEEDGTKYPNRVRFSHPNAPTDWAELDYVDILDGGGRITALVSFQDHLLIFKQNSVWALYGYDDTNFQLVNVTQSLGAWSAQTVATSGQGAYFFSWPEGVYEYRPSEGIFERSVQLKPIFRDGSFNPSALDETWLGYINNRLWFGAPYSTLTSADTAKVVFVWDPLLDAWTKFQCPNGCALGPFGQGHGGLGEFPLAAHREVAFVVSLDETASALDDLNGTPTGFSTLYATRWLDAGWPTSKKSWRRPDFVVREASAQYDLQVDVYRDYDESDLDSSYVITVDTGSSGVTWNDGVTLWGAAGVTYGRAPSGSRVTRGRTIGLARSVQVQFRGEVGKVWAVNAAVMKYIMRRFR